MTDRPVGKDTAARIETLDRILERMEHDLRIESRYSTWVCMGAGAALGVLGDTAGLNPYWLTAWAAIACGSLLWLVYQHMGAGEAWAQIARWAGATVAGGWSCAWIAGQVEQPSFAMVGILWIPALILGAGITGLWHMDEDAEG